MKENNPNNRDKIFEELEYFVDTSVKSMLNGYVPPKEYGNKSDDDVKCQEKIEVLEPYEIFNPFDNQ